MRPTVVASADLVSARTEPDLPREIVDTRASWVQQPRCAALTRAGYRTDLRTLLVRGSVR